MRVLVIGSGGREHALVWKLAQSPSRPEMYAAPGNAGIEELARCVSIPSTDVAGLLDLARQEKIDFTVVGPEAPLEMGIVDRFGQQGRIIFGPSQMAARLETSKVFAKDFMVRHGIPTAPYEVFDSPQEACRAVRQRSAPVVVKADGLAAGKGAIVARSSQEAEEAIERIMIQRVFGDAGLRVVVEQFLEGQEASILSIVDGHRHVTMVPSQDHKPIFDGDEGPNTGGMGAYAPAPVITDQVMAEVEHRILGPAVTGMAEEGCPFRGVLYAGLMITDSGPQVVEFNCRFGDPETQAVLPIFQGDLLELLLAAADGDVTRQAPLKFSGAAVCVIMASGGYPGPYQKGFEIRGLEDVASQDVIVFHAGTRRQGRRLLTDGGRVLGVTGLGCDVRQATSRAYQAVGGISFSRAYFRRDIAHRALGYGESLTGNSGRENSRPGAEEAPAG